VLFRSTIMAMIRSVRNIRAEVDTPMSRKVNMLIQAHSAEIAEELQKERQYIERFCNTEELTIDTNIDAPKQAMSAVVTGAEIFLPLEGLIDFEKELARLAKELEKWEKEVALVERKLSNEGFVAKAPEQLVEKEREKLIDYKEKYASVQARIAELEAQQ